jgi:hypothetical protein
MTAAAAMALALAGGGCSKKEAGDGQGEREEGGKKARKGKRGARIARPTRKQPIGAPTAAKGGMKGAVKKLSERPYASFVPQSAMIFGVLDAGRMLEAAKPLFAAMEKKDESMGSIWKKMKEEAGIDPGKIGKVGVVGVPRSSEAKAGKAGGDFSVQAVFIGSWDGFAGLHGKKTTEKIHTFDVYPFKKNYAGAKVGELAVVGPRPFLAAVLGAKSGKVARAGDDSRLAKGLARLGEAAGDAEQFLVVDLKAISKGLESMGFGDKAKPVEKLDYGAVFAESGKSVRVAVRGEPAGIRSLGAMVTLGMAKVKSQWARVAGQLKKEMGDVAWLDLDGFSKALGSAKVRLQEDSMVASLDFPPVKAAVLAGLLFFLPRQEATGSAQVGKPARALPKARRPAPPRPAAPPRAR